MTQQEGEPWAHSEPVAVELTEFDARTDFLGFALDPIHTSTAVVVTVELDGLTEIAWDGLVFLPRYSAGSSWAGNDLILRRLGGWPAGRIAVRVEIVDHFDESLVPKTTHAGVLSAATLTAAGTVENNFRPLVDANHIHVWNCDETSGALVLADSVGSADLTLQGGEGTAYALNQTAGGSIYPWIQGLLAGNTAPLASASVAAFNLSSVSFEFVVRFTTVPAGGQYQSLIRVDSPAAPVDTAYTAITNYTGSPKIFGGAYNDGPYPSGSFSTTTITGYNAPDITITAGVTYHVLWTYNEISGEQKIYIDGVLKNTISGIAVTLTNLGVFALGGLSGASQSLQGYIRDVRISNIVRDATYAAAAFEALTP